MGLSGVAARLQQQSSLTGLRPRPAATCSATHTGRQGALLKSRVPPRRPRRRQSIVVQPGHPAFEGAVTTQLNSALEPRQVAALIGSLGPYLSASHCAAAVALLAGMATGRDLPPQQLALSYQGPAAAAADLLTAKISQASLLDCARAVYGLARLQVQHTAGLLPAVVAHTRGRLREATPQALAGLALGLAQAGSKPPQDWLQELQLHAYAQMAGFSAQDLANLLFALSCWQQPCSQAFLQRCLNAFRGHWGSPACHAPTLVRFVYALTQLPACQPLPEGMQALQQPGTTYEHHKQRTGRRRLEALSNLMGSSNSSSSRPDHTSDNPGDAATTTTSSSSSFGAAYLPADGVASDDGSDGSSRQRRRGRTPAAAAAAAGGPQVYHIPSFNWLVAFCSECRRQIDQMKPAELSTLLWSLACLGHTPDLVFLEAWFRAGAARMHAATPTTLALALQALGTLQPGRGGPGGVSGRWLRLALARSREVLAASSGQQLSAMLWGLAELNYWPGAAWIDDWLQASEQQLAGMAPGDVSNVVWGVARLRFGPPQAWADSLSRAVTANLAAFDAPGLAIVIWGFTRLGLRPDRAWLLAFRAATAAEYDGSTAQKLGGFVAAALQKHSRAASRSS